MIQQLSNKYQKANAILLFTICFNGLVLPIHALGKPQSNAWGTSVSYNATAVNRKLVKPAADFSDPLKGKEDVRGNSTALKKTIANLVKENSPSIGGPSQPEMSAFKPVGTDNMVNLFTGDFSYNIPLLDVGGYPVNIFYDGGVSMEQEASWVGLGWNINPGNVNRNMRGVPDDFNGTDVLKQTQTMKPNITWGITAGADFEVVGIKSLGLQMFSGSIGGSLGVSFNNYLGPALDIGIKGNTALSLGSKSAPEKSAPTLGGSLSVNASSRSGVTFTPGLSLSMNAFKAGKGVTGGFGLNASTSFNSRTGIKALQISEQVSFNKRQGENRKGEKKENNNKISENIFSSSISFNKPSYIPSIRMTTTNSAFSGHFQLGSGVFGIYPSLEAEVYKQKSEVADEDRVQEKPMVGYLYLQKAAGNDNAVMDFTRLNDNEVTPSTPVISAPQYSYDVFSIQGEGTGGSIRAYRNDEGFVRDNKSSSKDKNISAGADVGIPGHFGANFNTINTPSTISGWNNGNKLSNITGFKDAANGWENVYFRNPGESSVLNPNQYDRIGGTDLVRYKLGGTGMSPTLEPVLEKFSKEGKITGTVPFTAQVQDRKKRTQVTSFLSAKEAAVIGLDKMIKNYNGTTILNGQNNLNYVEIARFDGTTRKEHHISQINVTEASGQRYVYGIPVYNIRQKDFTFTVANSENVADPDKVDFNVTEATLGSSNLSPTAQKDGYLQITETPAFAHSFLLSGLLSPDYVDVTGNGITEDDQGTAVKFNYSKMAGLSKWRTPLTTGTPKANFNAGKLTESKDDKGILSYGERESWYLHSVESKTMVALFKLEDRHDSKGSNSELEGINSSDNSAQKLKQIDLYSKADLKKNGIAGAKPIKTVHFEYSYNLCKGTASKPMPGNPAAGEGKLTLEKIWFTFNGQNRASKNQYVFSYGTTAAENPDYGFNASDRWGTYKPASANPASLKSGDYPYGIQDKTLKTTIDQNAGAWMLKKILLPSGGQMEVTYESDDYAFVQNKRAAVMMQVLGFGNTTTAITDRLYNLDGNGITENNYAFIKVPEACNNTQEVFQKYLAGIEQLSFKLAVNMPKGMEFLHSYATMQENNYGLYTADATHTTIWVKLNTVDGLSPLSLTAIEFLREQLPGQAFPGYDVLESDGLARVGDMLAGLLDGIKGAFKNPVKHLRQKGLAQTVDAAKCFVRLNDPDAFKYGGGYRVKKVKLKDNWKQMNAGQMFTSEYGQEYDYTTKEIFNGVERTISSGVASYEPSLGGDENPFQTMVQVSNKVPLGPASYGAIEMPVLDAFFPSASVGYSKVTVKAIKKGVQDPSKKSRSGIGKQVSEFYTAKDFPVYYSYTPFDPGTDKQASVASFGAFFFKYAFDSRALSQGFLVETNDMHGKMKSQASYPENDDKTPINFTQNFYRNTGSKGLDEKFSFVYAAEAGAIRDGNMGIDVELMTDTREFSVKSKSLEIQGQLDLFPIILPFWLPFIWPVFGSNENTYRAVTTTKVVTYHSILDRVVVIDKGSQVSTENLVFDAETGDVIVNKTNNEFKKPIYSTTYPAWWAYGGMGLAYKNIDAVYSNVNIRGGVITSGNVPLTSLESGDELYLIEEGSIPGDACVPALNTAAAPNRSLWVFDKTRDLTSIGLPAGVFPEFYIMDTEGKLYTRNGVSFRIVRSGKRNMLSAKVAAVTSFVSPVKRILGFGNKLIINNTSNVVAASAIEYKEKWQTDNEVFKRYIPNSDVALCATAYIENCSGTVLERIINPYRKGVLGVFKSHQSRVFYGSRNETDPLVSTDIAKNGFLNDFKLFWDFSEGALRPDYANAKWVWNSQVMRFNSKGMELETKDALGIFTAAQYGFNKTTPVAIANNSRYNEMFAEGFEDDSYDETLNTSLATCLKKHISFNGLPNSPGIVNLQTTGINAHSGKNVLAVNANSIAVRDNIPLTTSTSLPDNFSLNMQSDYTKELNQPGGNVEQFNITAGQYVQPAITFNNLSYNSTCSMRSKLDWTMSTNHTVPILVNNDFVCSFSTTQYVQVTSAETITINQNILQTYTGANQVPNHCFAEIAVYIFDLNDNYLFSGSLAGSNTSNSFSGLLPCGGIYKIYSAVWLRLNAAITPGIPENLFVSDVSYSVTPNVTGYKSLQSANSCFYTKPIAGAAAMLNPQYSVTPGKKMLFSAWVHEDCAVPCSTQDFTKSNIEIWSGGTNLGAGKIKRTGTIIEGWQKIEGEFEVPSNTTATTAEIRFINTNAAPMYVDDIRIHPYNANIKSYVYDPVNLRLLAELDANNYASFYEYDDEGTLIRTKVETKEGIKTVTETRSAKQKNITTIQ